MGAEPRLTWTDAALERLLADLAAASGQFAEGTRAQVEGYICAPATCGAGRQSDRAGADRDLHSTPCIDR